ncbi:GNAT family N-acetyltransferase [Robertmurraya massiliosenegalensis]|uniref:GNAT family N-acetyltransferase n=1 Tax=Robertmurraya TaxID=2837507 RepID=UPI0039A5F47F
MQIYQATLADLEEVATLFDMYRQFYQQPTDLEGARNYIRKRLENKESIIFIVKNNEKPLGFTQLYPIFSSISMARAWILNDLFVEKDARKQGVGEMLLHKAKEFAVQTGSKSISLSTALDNHSAQRLYEKHGYIRDSQFYHYELNLVD